MKGYSHDDKYFIFYVTSSYLNVQFLKLLELQACQITSPVK